jgi:hypothetical protein
MRYKGRCGISSQEAGGVKLVIEAPVITLLL